MYIIVLQLSSTPIIPFYQNRTSLGLPESQMYHLFAPCPLQRASSKKVSKRHDDNEDTSQRIARRMLQHIRGPGNFSLRRQSENNMKSVCSNI